MGKRKTEAKTEAEAAGELAENELGKRREGRAAPGARSLGPAGESTGAGPAGQRRGRCWAMGSLLKVSWACPCAGVFIVPPL